MEQVKDVNLNEHGYEGNRTGAEQPDLIYGLDSDIWCYIYMLILLMCAIIIAMCCAKILTREHATMRPFYA